VTATWHNENRTGVNMTPVCFFMCDFR